jgi:hypothetical protein
MCFEGGTTKLAAPDSSIVNHSEQVSVYFGRSQVSDVRRCR